MDPIPENSDTYLIGSTWASKTAPDSNRTTIPGDLIKNWGRGNRCPVSPTIQSALGIRGQWSLSVSL